MCPYVQTFVAQTTKDKNHVLEEMREKESGPRLRLVMMTTTDTVKPHSFPCTKADLVRLHATDFLLNLFEAPDIIKQTLINIKKIETIVVGTEKTDAEALFRSYANIRILVTPQFIHRCKVSRYGGAMGITNDRLRPPKLFRAADTKKKAELEASLQRQRAETATKEKSLSELIQSEKQLEASKGSTDEAIRKLRVQLEAVKKLKSDIAGRRKLLESLEGEENTAEEEAKLQGELKRLCLERVKAVRNHHEHTRQMATKALDQDGLALARMQALARKVHLTREMERRDLELKEARIEEKRL